MLEAGGSYTYGLVKESKELITFGPGAALIPTEPPSGFRSIKTLSVGAITGDYSKQDTHIVYKSSEIYEVFVCTVRRSDFDMVPRTSRFNMILGMARISTDSLQSVNMYLEGYGVEMILNDIAGNVNPVWFSYQSLNGYYTYGQSGNKR